jgi:alkanesulfonate monooxygenase SsuD/methylene tetrahydromethanopterin reductase-like flavin-dependent oxidoreductase (luciferase family)
MAEPLGFDSIWSVEHHFTDYTMCPDVIQFLTYMAGKTQRVKLGSMVVVLPWHDPVRIAEQIVLLDHLSGGRMILGLGRGLARVEYEGFRIDQGDGRQRFLEYATLLLNALEGAHLRRGGVARVHAHHGQARPGAPRHPAEAVGRRQAGLSDLPPGVPRSERYRAAATIVWRLLLRG